MTERMEGARLFLKELAEHPPALQCDPRLLPELFAKTSAGSYASSAEIAAIIGRSQALAVKVLAVANSAAYGLESTVSTLERAVVVLGMLEVRALATLFAVMGAVPAKKLPKGFPDKDLWEHQILTGRLGRMLAKTVNAGLGIDHKGPEAEATKELPGLKSAHIAPEAAHVNPEAAHVAPEAAHVAPEAARIDREAARIDPEAIYVGGILHDLGKLILGLLRPADWKNISEICQSESCGFSLAEDRYWGLDHGTVGGQVLKYWNLPDLLCDVVSWHHYPDLSLDHKPAIKVLAAANLLATNGLAEDGTLPPAVSALLPRSAAMDSALAAALPHLAATLADKRAGLLAAQL